MNTLNLNYQFFYSYLPERILKLLCHQYDIFLQTLEPSGTVTDKYIFQPNLEPEMEKIKKKFNNFLGMLLVSVKLYEILDCKGRNEKNQQTFVRTL